MESLLMMSIFLLGFCTGEPPVHGTHTHDHQEFAQPHPFQHHQENEIEGLQTPKFDFSSYNSLSPKTSGEEYTKSVSNEYGTPRFGLGNPRPFPADNEKPDSMYGVPKNQMNDPNSNFNSPPELYGIPSSHVDEMSSRNHEDRFTMKEHNTNTDFQGYENSQRESASQHDHEEHSSFAEDDMSSDRDFNGLPEVVAARQSVSPLKGAVEGITQAIIRPNPPLKNRNAMTSPPRSHHKSAKSRTLASKKHTAKYALKLSASQGYAGVPQQRFNNYEQESLQHHLEREEPSKTYLPTGRNAYDNDAEIQEDRGDQNYEFEYRVNDYQSASDFGHRESRQFGTTRGMYHVLLPDGRKQIVEYEADEDGYKPIITYEEPEIDTRHQSEGYDNNSNNVESKIQQEQHHNTRKYNLKLENDQGNPQGRSQDPY